MKINKLILNIFLVLSFSFLSLNDASALLSPIAKQAWGPISKRTGALSDEVIEGLSKMIKNSGDATKVKKIIGNKNLSPEVLEDTYIRIAIHRKSISRAEAELMYKNLHGVNGFSSTMSKIVGVNPVGTKGHINELRIANAAVEHGFKVEGIGIKHIDELKKSPTDLDVLISKNGKKFPIEAKDYFDVTFNDLSNTMRPDMDSLVAFKNKSSAPSKLHPVITFTNRPSNPNVLKAIEAEANKRGIEPIFGNAEQQIIQIEALMNTFN